MYPSVFLSCGQDKQVMMSATLGQAWVVEHFARRSKMSVSSSATQVLQGGDPAACCRVTEPARC